MRLLKPHPVYRGWTSATGFWISAEPEGTQYWVKGWINMSLADYGAWIGEFRNYGCHTGADNRDTMTKVPKHVCVSISTLSKGKLFDLMEAKPNRHPI